MRFLAIKNLKPNSKKSTKGYTQFERTPYLIQEFILISERIEKVGYMNFNSTKKLKIFCYYLMIFCKKASTNHFQSKTYKTK
jgi:hypothetical protein